jgi:hypothetical protein
MLQDEVRRGHQAFLLTVAAFVWSVALLGAAFLFPAYGSSATSSAGGHVSGSLTLVQVNGLWALVPMGAPIIIVSLAWAALYRQCSRGSAVAEFVAGALVGLLVLGSVVALASVGLFIVPAAALLGRAAALTPSGSSRCGGLTSATG